MSKDISLTTASLLGGFLENASSGNEEKKGEITDNRKIALSVSVLVLVATATAAVLVIRILPSTVRVTTPGLAVLDSTCTIAQTNLSFPDIDASPGATSQLAICIKNTGNVGFYILKGTANSITFTGLSTGLSGDWATQQTLPAQLGVGQTMDATITLTNDGSALGTLTFTTVFTGFDSASA